MGLGKRTEEDGDVCLALEDGLCADLADFLPNRRGKSASERSPDSGDWEEGGRRGEMRQGERRALLAGERGDERGTASHILVEGAPEERLHKGGWGFTVNEARQNRGARQMRQRRPCKLTQQSIGR